MDITSETFEYTPMSDESATTLEEPLTSGLVQRVGSEGNTDEVRDCARDRGRRVTVNVPRIPFAPHGDPDSVDADYYREGARNIRFNAGLGKSSIGGSNLTEVVAALCDAVADALSN